jgi:hypothetical protein
VANTSKTRGARAVPKTASKTVAPAAPKVKRAYVRKAKPAPVEEPAVLTATQALAAANSATGEPAPKVRKPRTPKAEAVAVPKEVPPVPEAIPAEPVAVAPEPVVATVPPPPSIEETLPATAEEPAPVPAAAEGNTVMTDVMETTKKIAEEAKTKFESAFADINAKAKASVEKSTKAIGELSDLTKGNVEAFVESGKIAAKGVEALGQDAAEYSRKNFEKATATLKSLAAVKSPTEFFQLQSEMMSSAFDSFAKETAKSSEAMLKLAGDISQPISTRVSIVTEKVKSLAA